MAVSNYPVPDTTKAIEELAAKLAAEVARLEEKIDLGSKLATTQIDLAALKSDQENFNKQLQIYASLVEKAEAVRQETKRDIFKIVAVGTALALVAGIIGIPTIKFYLKSAVDRQAEHITSVMDPLVQFEFNYGRGAGLLGAKNSKEAIPYLLNCFPGHEYDPSVLIPLLNAMDDGEDWTNGKMVVDKLREHPEKLSQIKDPMAWNNLAAVEGDVGTEEPAYLPLARQSLDRASELVANDDLETRRYILQNSWIVGILTHDDGAARAAVDDLLKINDKSLPTWETVNGWKQMKLHFASDPKGRAAAREMWRRLELARSANAQKDAQSAAAAPSK